MNAQIQPVFDQLKVHSGDEDIKLMLAENAFQFPQQPTHGDTAITAIRDEKSKHDWLVIRFYHSADAGYLAFGLPSNTPEHLRRHCWRFILENQPSIGDWQFTELDALINN